MRQERERDAFCFASSLVSRIFPDVRCVSAARYHVTAVIKLRDVKKAEEKWAGGEQTK